MAAVWSRNELVAAKRIADMVVYTADGLSPAPRETDFTGYVYIWRGSATAELAVGTIVNKRIPITVADDTVEAVVTGAGGKLQQTAHGREIGDGPFQWTTSGTLPAGMSLATNYWVNPFDVDNLQLATSLANCYAGTYITITDSGSGTHTMIDVPAYPTGRGLDGDFQYTATQAETDFAGSEAFLAIIHSSYDRARTSVNMTNGAQGFDALGEGGNTYGDIMRAIYAALLGESGDYTTGTYTFMDPTTGTITRFTITADATGRVTVTPGTLTGP